MAASIRQQIISAMVTRLGTITTANGYLTNIGNSVALWRTTEFEKWEMPSCSIADTQDTAEVSDLRPNGGHERHKLTVEILAVISDGDNTPATLEQARADIINAIGIDPRWGGVAEWTTPSGDNKQISQKDKVFGAVKVTVTVSYRTLAWNPNA